MKFLKQIILLTLTLLVLVSSTGISVGMHLCGGEVADLALFGEVADCPMEQQKEPLPSCHKVPVSDSTADCCDDQTFVFDHSDATSSSKTLILSKTAEIKFIAAVKVIILQLFAPEAAPKPTYAFYESPPLARDIPVLVQAFLL